MMKCDATWLAESLARLPNETLSPILNLGSSTRHFREVEQPHIHEIVFAPLDARGVAVIHTDIKADDGVDLVCDLMSDEGLAAIQARAPKALVCTHMLEHVPNAAMMAQRMLAAMPAGGLLFVSVPSSYHQHNDPIDTMFRPSPQELASLFPGTDVLDARELEGDYYWIYVRKRPFTLFFRHFFRFWFPFLGFAKWKRSMGKLYWLFYPYKVSAVALRKRA
jgi:hypothetical protein